MLEGYNLVYDWEFLEWFEGVFENHRLFEEEVVGEVGKMWHEIVAEAAIGVEAAKKVCIYGGQGKATVGVGHGLW